ncbi:MAG TPA: hypothetical protein VD865_03660 [Stenotrophomonas sp.]|nr:hypothetical protein [Stenotrophomonas sp.]
MNPNEHDDDLLAGLRGLPTRRTPPESVWQGINAALDADVATTAPLRPAARIPRPASRRRWRLPLSLAAAASLLAVTVLLLPHAHVPEQTVNPVLSQAPAQSQPVQAPVQAPLLAQADSLSGEYHQAMAALPSAPVPAELQPALRELDDSAAQIRSALRERPDARYLLGQLRRTYDKRLELTRMAALGAPARAT